MSQTAHKGLPKCPSGINGLDELTEGGLPRNRPTLVCGGAGCGKTLLAIEFLIRGAVDYGEPGAFISFEETPDELSENVASLGFDLAGMIEKKHLVIDYVRIDPSEIVETGVFDLEALFVRIGYAIDQVNAKRLVIDTPESLFTGLTDAGILRTELKRLFQWIKDRGVTAIITGERGESTLTRHGLEEYVSDCVISLDHRVRGQVSTRRLRVVKYRGSSHGTNEYPFMIGPSGIIVLPITSLGLDHPASEERISTGVPSLDAMMEGKGFFRGNSMLIAGTAGTGKTTLASHFVDAACRRGETCIYFAFEEGREQILRNLRSVGLELRQWIDRGLLTLVASRPTVYGLETHLAMMYDQIRRIHPQNVIVDPVSNFISVGSTEDVHGMVTRLIDFAKSQQITAILTHLNTERGSESTDIAISSLIDTWINLRDYEADARRRLALCILKSRGMSHSREVREFQLTRHGFNLLDSALAADPNNSKEGM